MKKKLRTFKIEDPVWRKYRVYAFENDTTASALIRDHIIDDLTKAGKIEPEKEVLD